MVLGDFNLDYSKINDVNYCHAGRFDDFNEILDVNDNLVQLVNFPTWSRMVGMSYRSSILDHIYVEDPAEVTGYPM